MQETSNNIEEYHLVKNASLQHQPTFQLGDDLSRSSQPTQHTKKLWRQMNESLQKFYYVVMNYIWRQIFVKNTVHSNDKFERPTITCGRLRLWNRKLCSRLRVENDCQPVEKITLLSPDSETSYDNSNYMEWIPRKKMNHYLQSPWIPEIEIYICEHECHSSTFANMKTKSTFRCEINDKDNNAPLF